MLEHRNDEHYSTPRERLLEMRIGALEDRLEQMRLSRRVLLQILEKSETEHRERLENMEKENQRLRREVHRLQKQTTAYATEIMEKNRMLVANAKF